jgi:ATP-dependent helicase HrpA
VCAELVETTRLFGRGIANIEPLWIEQVAGHLLKKQLLDPHWEKKGGGGDGARARHALWTGGVQRAARAVRAGRPAGRARNLHPRRPGGRPVGDPAAVLAANQKLVKQVQELEHKARRQDVLVDEELIYAFYDQQLPKDVHSGATFERWYREASRAEPRC